MHSIDPAKPQILFELPSEKLTVIEKSSALVLRLDGATASALKNDVAAAGATESSRSAARPVWTMDSFQSPKHIKDYDLKWQNVSSQHWPVHYRFQWLHRRNAVSFRELVERTQQFFEKILRSKNLQGRPAAGSSKEFSHQVYHRLREVAPTKVNGTKPFTRFLRDVHEHAPPTLPTLGM